MCAKIQATSLPMLEETWNYFRKFQVQWHHAKHGTDLDVFSILSAAIIAGEGEVDEGNTPHTADQTEKQPQSSRR